MNSAPPHAALTMLVRRLESIARLSHEERHGVERLPLRTHVLHPRQDIVRDGDTPSHCCLLLEGWAFRYKLLDESRRQILSFHVPGDVPNLQSLHLGPMDHGLATLTRATVAFIPHESLLDLAERLPGFAGILWRDTLIDGAVFRAWMTGIGQQSAFGRMARLFCELYLRLEAVGLASNHCCTLPIKQSELGDALGLSTVHVNRTLQEMRARELITWHNQKLTIHAWDKLARAGEFNPAYLHLNRAG